MVKKSKLVKGLIVACLIASILVPLICYFVQYANDYDFVISAYTADIEVDEYGDMHVVEKITNDYSSTNTVFYKNLIYGKNNDFSDASDRSYLVEDVKVKVEENNTIVFDSDLDKGNYKNFVGYSYNHDVDERGDYITCSDTQVNCAMIFYYDSEGIADHTTFIYEYTIKGVVTQYKDISEFNWVVLDNQPMNIKNVKINITLPEGTYNIENEDTFFHGASNASREFVDDNKILITCDKLFSGEQIEVRLLLDNEIFTSVRDTNKSVLNRYQDILDFEASQQALSKLEYSIFVYGTIGLFVIVLIVFALIVVRCYRKYDKEFKSDFYNEYYRELPADYPPAVMGYLYKFKEIDDNDLTATLLDLVRRKYLIIKNPLVDVNSDNADYEIVLDDTKDLNDLTELEKHLIDWFIKDIGNGKRVSSKQISSYCDDIDGAREYQANNKRWLQLVEKEANKYDFFDKDIGKAKKRFSLYSIFIFLASFFMFSGYGLVNYTLCLMLSINLFCLGVAYVIYVNTFNRRSKQGNEEYVRWKAFNKFLEEFSTFEDYPVPSLIIWEHYLVYATSFGIADKVMKQLKIKFNVSEINDVDTTFVMYYGLRYNNLLHLNSTVHSAKTSAIRTISSYNSSRSGLGGGSSGGFSGGSSFGGGGGSFGGR